MPRNFLSSRTRRAGCVIIHDESILLVHQASSGFWGFPKGRMNPFETEEAAAIREVFEETGIQLLPNQLVAHIKCGDSRYYKVRLETAPSVQIDAREIDNYMWARPANLSILTTSAITKKVAAGMKLLPGVKP